MEVVGFDLPESELVRLNSLYETLQFFESEHLPEPLRAISGAIRAVAWVMAAKLSYHPETSAGLRKLLEAKDCFVRAALIK